MRTPAFPLRYDPGGVAAHIGVDFVTFQLTSRAVFRRLVGFVTDLITDPLPRAALHLHFAGFYLNVQIVRTRERAIRRAGPRIAFFLYGALLRHTPGGG